MTRNSLGGSNGESPSFLTGLCLLNGRGLPGNFIRVQGHARYEAPRCFVRQGRDYARVFNPDACVRR